MKEEEEEEEEEKDEAEEEGEERGEEEKEASKKEMEFGDSAICPVVILFQRFTSKLNYFSVAAKDLMAFAALFEYLFGLSSSRSRL